MKSALIIPTNFVYMLGLALREGFFNKTVEQFNSRNMCLWSIHSVLYPYLQMDKIRSLSYFTKLFLIWDRSNLFICLTMYLIPLLWIFFCRNVIKTWGLLSFILCISSLAGPSGRSPTAIVGSNPTGGIDVCCKCCVLSDRGLCDVLITRPEESYRLWCVVVCDLETSRMRNDEAMARSATKKKKQCQFHRY